MKKSSLLFVPSGGLANRMRAIASAYTLAKETSSKLQVVWFRDWTLNAPFHDIFMPIDKSILSLREASIVDKIINDRPRKRNMYFFRIPQSIIYDRCIQEKEITPLKEENFDFHKWITDGHSCYMSCYQEFGTYEDSTCRMLFRPTKQVEEKINANVAKFSAHTIGMHIRRTDNSESISKSPTRLFFDYADKEIQAHDDTTIFLATDSEDVKEEMANRYGERIITSQNEADRNSIAGIREGLADMYTLSKTDKIYGSAGSTFSVMAAKIGGNELNVLEKKKI
jgi:hypothetical protein